MRGWGGEIPVDLTLLPEHRRGHGALHGGMNQGLIDVDRLQTVMVGLSLPCFDGGRLFLAVDVSPWLRSDAPCSAERLFCHFDGRTKTASRFIPGAALLAVARLVGLVRDGAADVAAAQVGAVLAGGLRLVRADPVGADARPARPEARHTDSLQHRLEL